MRQGIIIKSGFQLFREGRFQFGGMWLPCIFILLLPVNGYDNIDISVTSEVHDKTEDFGNNKTCGFDDTHEGWLNEQPIEFFDNNFHNIRDKELFKYNVVGAGDTIHPPWNANNNSRYIEIVLVIDTRIFIQFGRNSDSINSMCKQIARKMNSIYMPLNIYVALVGVIIWRDFDQGQNILSINSLWGESKHLKCCEMNDGG